MDKSEIHLNSQIKNFDRFDRSDMRLECRKAVFEYDLVFRKALAQFQHIVWLVI